jgi:CelD/BcsL family acetyltransferase involved in cellulose biosynthesis
VIGVNPEAVVALSVLDDYGSAGAEGLDRATWDEFVKTHGGDLYMSYDWCRLWWEQYGEGRELRLFIGRDGKGAVVGLLPMFVETLWLGPVRLRWAKIVGCDFLPGVVSPVLCAPDAAEMLRQVIVALMVKDQCDVVALGPLSELGGKDGENRMPAHVRVACPALKDVATLAQDVQTAVHTTFQLPGTFDAYLGGLNKRQKQNLRRDLNLFAKNFTSRVDVVRDGEELQREFAAFRRMHDRQWQAENKLGHFNDWPHSAAFNESLVRELAPLGRVRLVRLWANEQVVSYQYCLTFGDRLYWRLPARLVGEDWDRYGMGRLGLVMMIEVAIGEGIRWIEGGLGHYDYKMQLGGREVPLVSMVIVSNRLKSRLRWKMFQKVARLLHLFYYRIWFGRIAPRLPLPRRRLWKSWIRSRP